MSDIEDPTAAGPADNDNGNSVKVESSQDVVINYDDDDSAHDIKEEKSISISRNGNGKRKVDDVNDDQNGTSAAEDAASGNDGGDQTEIEQSNGNDGDAKEESSSDKKMESPLKKSRNENKKGRDDNRSNDKPKMGNRFRMDELLDPTEEGIIMTRILVNEVDMARVIGGGGSNIKRLRNQYQCKVKGQDTDVKDEKIVVIQGYAPDVLACFDMLTKTLCMSNTEDTRRLTLLVESRHAGKVIGSKGSTINSIKNNARAQFIKLSQDDMTQSGVSLRELTLDGDCEAIMACHYLLHAEFVPLRVLNPKKFTERDRDRDRDRDRSDVRDGDFDRRGSRDARDGRDRGDRQSPPAMQMQPAGPKRETLQFEDLIPSGYSIPTETVDQLKDMRHYLNSSFRLELVVTRVVAENRGPAPMGPGPNVGQRGYNNMPANQHHHQQGPPHHHSLPYQQPQQHEIYHQGNQHHSHQQPMHHHQQHHHQSSGGNMMERDSRPPHNGNRDNRDEDRVTTRIRAEQAGPLIGKGGRGIRGLNERFNCRVEIVQDTAPDGTREVIITPDTRFPGGGIDKCLQCRDQIHHTIDQMF